MTVSLLAAIAGAVAYGLASVLQAVGAKRAASSGGGLAKIARQVPYLAGLVVDFGGWLLSLAALRRLPVFVVQAVLAGSLVVTVVAARLVLKTALRAVDGAAVVVTVVSLAVLASAATEGAARRLSTPGEIVMLAAAAAVAGGAVVVVKIGWANLAGAVAGLAFGGTALAARAADLSGSVAHVVWQAPVAALVVFGLTGLLTYAAALERGAVGSVTAALWVVETIVPGAIGLAALGDRTRPGWGLPAAVAFAAAIAAIVVLARSPATTATG